MCSKYKIVSQEKLSVNHFVHNPFLFIAHHPKWFIDTQITFHSSIFPLTLFYLYGYLCIFCMHVNCRSIIPLYTKKSNKHINTERWFLFSNAIVGFWLVGGGDYEILPIMPFCPCLKKLTLFVISASYSIQNLH